MKIAVCGDIHFSTNSSIIRSIGNKFSTRLENCIKSIEWFEEISQKYDCNKEVFLGDFFDKSSLNDEEITAISSIHWNKLDKTIIVGNHESSVADLRFSATSLFKNTNFNVITKPTLDKELNIGYLPYCQEENRKTILETFDVAPKIIFSHNDLKNVAYGNFTTQFGYDIDDVSKNCEIFINGHIHNFGQVRDNVINLGVLTGQNFCENAELYQHVILIIDTDTLAVEFIENPYSFNFYKIEISTEDDLSKIKTLKTNAIVSAICNEDLVESCKAAFEASENVLINRITIVKNIRQSENAANAEELHSADYKKKLVEFCMQNIEHSTILDEELAQICM